MRLQLEIQATRDLGDLTQQAESMVDQCVGLSAGCRAQRLRGFAARFGLARTDGVEQLCKSAQRHLWCGLDRLLRVVVGALDLVAESRELFRDIAEVDLREHGLIILGT